MGVEKIHWKIYTTQYSQSRLMPTDRHFLNLQYWQRLRFKRITMHLASRRHRYSICFWMLRRKNPCGRNGFESNECDKLGDLIGVVTLQPSHEVTP